MQKLRRIFSHLRYLFPSKLPKGSEEFEKFCSSIFDLYQIPKEDGYYHSIAVMMQHLPATQVYKSKSWFASCIHNAQVRETAFYKIQEIQKRNKEKAEAENTLEKTETASH